MKKQLKPSKVFFKWLSRLKKGLNYGAYEYFVNWHDTDMKKAFERGRKYEKQKIFEMLENAIGCNNDKDVNKAFDRGRDYEKQRVLEDGFFND